MLQGFILWVQAFLNDFGLSGIFIISFFESFIFPVPTATLIAPMTALGLDPLPVVIVASIASVLGAFVGYGLGYYLGRPVAERLFKKYLKGMEGWFGRYGVWAVFIAAFTPVPFKVFTWGSGIFRFNLVKFGLASAVGRVLQFTVAAYVGDILGPWILGLFGL